MEKRQEPNNEKILFKKRKEKEKQNKINKHCH